MRTSSVLAFVAAVAPAALAAPYFTSPIATTSCAAGQPCTLSWQDDGVAPTLADFGDCTIGVYAGSQNQQSLMQAISPANAATTGSVVFTPDAGMGENSGSYFIKMVSTSKPDPAQPQYMASAYSAMFTLTGMTGKFTDDVKAQIAGTAASSGAVASGAAATSPVAGAAVTSSVAASVASSATTSAAASGASSASRASSSSASRSASASSSSSTASANGASAVHVAGMGAIGATVAALLAAFL